MQFLAIVLLSILAAVTYGVIHDQITGHISLEYFTIGHAPSFTPNRQRCSASAGCDRHVVGRCAVGHSARLRRAAGRRPKRSAASLVRPLAMLFVVAAGCAAIAGIIGYAFAVTGAMRLADFLAVQMPPEKHTPFLIAGWMHNTAGYAAGFLGGILLIVFTWRSREPAVTATPLHGSET